MAVRISGPLKGGRQRVTLSLAQFQRQFPGMAVQVAERAIVDLQCRLVEKVYEAVVETTPVLTGKARHNWQMGINSKPTEKHEGVAGVDVTGAPMTSDERSRVRAITKRLREMKAGQKVWITNRQNYVIGLDLGDSTKAPHGIRAVAVDRALSANLKGVRSSSGDEGGQ